jgi:uncharacterized protein YgbK (DUF1537 family)
LCDDKIRDDRAKVVVDAFAECTLMEKHPLTPMRDSNLVRVL